MAKRISAFRDFCQEDQIALLKDGCTEVMILKGVVQFDPFKNSWKVNYFEFLINMEKNFSHFFQYL